jgi:choline dehydrogenase-like flavoprotein
MKTIKAKICVVGSGVAGCLCAKYLATTGNEIVILERGARVTHSWRMQTREHEQPVPTAEHHHAIVQGWKEKVFRYVYAAGGSTNHWTGQTPRFLPDDFRMKSAYGVMEDWPIGYEELEPYYCFAEEELAIAGASDNPRIPRSRPYPQPAHPFSPVDRILQNCFPPGTIVSCPQARPTRDVGQRPSCCGSAVCNLCPVDSKYTPMNSHIPELEGLPNVQFLYETVVLNLHSNGGRRIDSVTARQKDQELKIEADLFVLAANGLENPAIILRSKEVKHHPLVGKYLFDHQALHVYVITSRECYPEHGSTVSTAHSYHFYDGDFRTNRTAALTEIFNVAAINISDLSYSVAMDQRLTGTALRKEVTRQFRSQIGFAFLLEDLPDQNRFLRIGSKRNSAGLPLTEIYYPKHSNYLELTQKHILEVLPKLLVELAPRKIIPESVGGAGHILGTCRMGDFKTGVVDKTLRYHEMDNLFILGGSAFTTYSPSNPTLTIAALSIRLGKHLQSFS